MTTDMRSVEYDRKCGPRCRSTVVVLSKFERGILEGLCDKEDTTISDILRKALKEYYLSTEEREKNG